LKGFQINRNGEDLKLLSEQEFEVKHLR